MTLCMKPVEWNVQIGDLIITVYSRIINFSIIQITKN